MADYDDLFEIMKNMRHAPPASDPVPDELIRKICWRVLRANGGNTQRWRFLVIRTRDQAAVQVWYKKAFDEVVARYLKSTPPPA